MENFNNIKELRTGMAMTQAQLVEKMNLPGFGAPDLSRIENGKAAPTPEQEEALCRALQAHPVELYGQWKEIPVRNQKTHKTRIERKREDAPFDVQELVCCFGEGGKDNARQKRELMYETDTRDRGLRRLIQKAYSFGYLIANDQDGRGYYLIDTVEEAKRYYRQERARDMAIVDQKLRPLARYIRENGGTLE